MMSQYLVDRSFAALSLVTTLLLCDCSSPNLAIEGNQPNTEVFLNLLLTAAFAILARAGNNRIGFGKAIVVGLLFVVEHFEKVLPRLGRHRLAVLELATSDDDVRPLFREG